MHVEEGRGKKDERRRKKTAEETERSEAQGNRQQATGKREAAVGESVQCSRSGREVLVEDGKKRNIVRMGWDGMTTRYDIVWFGMLE